MYTREEFEEVRKKSAKEMSQNVSLRNKMNEIVIEADKYNWMHQTTWLGEPSINPTGDLFAIQEMIYKAKPKYILEIGVAWGGTLLFCATLLDVLDIDGKVIGVDIYIPDDLRERIYSHKKLANKIELINASSIEPFTLDMIKSKIGNSKELLVHLDSNHTHEHVLKELNMYSPLVGKGHYLICGDTFVENIPEIVENRPRPWGKGNNPMTALNEFLFTNKNFIHDEEIENKMLFTCNTKGYLKCIKDN